LYHQAKRLADQKSQAAKDEANTIGCRLPFWVPSEEYPLWEWNERKMKHEKLREPISMSSGPYWVPMREWRLWRPDPIRGWVLKDSRRWDEWRAKRALEEEVERLKQKKALKKELEEEARKKTVAVEGIKGGESKVGKRGRTEEAVLDEGEASQPKRSRIEKKIILVE
jgi:hypothetical protein